MHPSPICQKMIKHQGFNIRTSRGMDVQDEKIQFMTSKFKKKSSLRKFMEEEFQFQTSRRTFKI